MSNIAGKTRLRIFGSNYKADEWCMLTTYFMTLLRQAMLSPRLTTTGRTCTAQASLVPMESYTLANQPLGTNVKEIKAHARTQTGR